jgi:hypothetical protein
MKSFTNFLHSVSGQTKYLALLAVFVLANGCATMYVDNSLKDVTAAQVKKPAEAKPVQLLFNFQTKDVNNARVTKILQKDVESIVKDSGLVASTSDQAAANQAVLSVTVNNVPITSEKEAMSKGFATGLTFGLAGSAVSDGYICTIEYLPPGATEKLTVKSQHAIHTTIGAKGAPTNGIKAKSPDEAVKTMMRQIITKGLIDLSMQPGFK